MTRTKSLIMAFAMLLVAACGQSGQLVRNPASPGPAVPTGEARAPTAAEQTTPNAQSRPRRSDEVLKQSQEREADEFDLPPS